MSRSEREKLWDSNFDLQKDESEAINRRKGDDSYKGLHCCSVFANALQYMSRTFKYIEDKDLYVIVDVLGSPYMIMDCCVFCGKKLPKGKKSKR